jgi:hypothetical protein
LPHSWNSGIISTGIIFAFTYMFLHCIQPPTPFPHLLSPPIGIITPLPPTGRTCSALLFSDFVEEKRKKNDVLLV